MGIGASSQLSYVSVPGFSLRPCGMERWIRRDYMVYHAMCTYIFDQLFRPSGPQADQYDTQNCEQGARAKDPGLTLRRTAALAAHDDGKDKGFTNCSGLDKLVFASI